MAQSVWQRLTQRAAKQPLARWWPRAQSKTDEVVFPPGFLASLERLRIAALKAMGGGLREGHRLGAYKGGQLEFHGHRSYTPGDELRYVDWNSYARLGRPYVKEFAREEAGVLHLLLDATPSMNFGQPSKWAYARRLAALFAHVAISSKDTVYLHIFSSDGLETYPRRRQKAVTEDFMRFLEKSRVQHAQSGELKRFGGVLGETIPRFLRAGPLTGGAMLLSDFWYNEADIAQAASRLAGAGFDASGIQIVSSEEVAPEIGSDLLAFSDEEAEAVPVPYSADLGARYQTEFEKHRRAVEVCFRRRGGNFLLTQTDAPIEKALIQTLRQRRWVV